VGETIPLLCLPTCSGTKIYVHTDWISYLAMSALLHLVQG